MGEIWIYFGCGGGLLGGTEEVVDTGYLDSTLASILYRHNLLEPVIVFYIWMPYRTMESITFQKLGSDDFGQIANSVLNKSSIWQHQASASDKAKIFAKIFSKNCNWLMYLLMYFPFLN